MTDVKEQVNRVGLALTERNLKFEHVDTYERPVIVLNFGGGDFSFTHLSLNVVFDEDGESAQIVTSPIASVPAERTARLLMTINECNRKFRWVRFYLDGENDIVANADLLFDEQNVGPVCVELIMRTAGIIDDAYPDIMRAIWG